MSQASPNFQDDHSSSNPSNGGKVDNVGDKWSATKYNNTASFVYSDVYTRPTLDLLQAKEGERILDFGCGSGELTRGLQDALGPNGLVIGLDSSQSMV
jgi:ubiquinone/menaquinone biosynthesis C-methylase UbiE